MAPSVSPLVDMCSTNLAQKPEFITLQNVMVSLRVQISLPHFSSALIWKTLAQQPFEIGSGIWCLSCEGAPCLGRRPWQPHGYALKVQILPLLLTQLTQLCDFSKSLYVSVFLNKKQ